MDLMSSEVLKEFQQNILLEMQNIIDNIKMQRENPFIRTSKDVNVYPILNKFCDNLTKYQDALKINDKIEDENPNASLEKCVAALIQFDHEMSVVLLLCISFDETFGNSVPSDESQFMKLQIQIDEIRKIDKVLKTEVKTDRWKRKLTEFTRTLNEEEIGETTYSLENTKASWKNRMDDIKQLHHELSEAYLVGSDMEKDFEAIEKVYYSKLRELNKKINLLKEAETVRNAEGIGNLQKILEQIETKIQQIPQLAKDRKGDCVEGTKVSENKEENQQKQVNVKMPEVMENIATYILKQIQQMSDLHKDTSMEGAKYSENVNNKQPKPVNTEKSEVLAPIAIRNRFRKKIIKFKKSLDEDEIGKTIYFLQNTKTSWEKQMSEIKELEQQVTSLYLLDNDMDKDIKIIETLHKSQLTHLNRKINALKEAEKAEKTQAFENLVTISEQIQMEIQELQQLQMATAKGIEVFENDRKQEKAAKIKKSVEDVVNLEPKATMLDRFREKIAKFRISLNEEESGKELFSLEARKASWEEQMDAIKQLEHELATIYFIGNDIDEDFNDIEELNELKLKELNRKINALREANKEEENDGIAKLQKLLVLTQRQMKEIFYL